MRLIYIQNSPKDLSSQEQDIVERIKLRRGSKGLVPLDLTLLHSPVIADGWNALLGAVRTKASLEGDVVGIAICRTLLVAGAWHEWNNHVTKLLATENFDENKLAVLKEIHLLSQGNLDDRQWAVLQYADHMSRAVSVPNQVFRRLEEVGFVAKEIVELTTVIAAYNMVARLFVALDIAESNEQKPKWLDNSVECS